MRLAGLDIEKNRVSASFVSRRLGLKSELGSDVVDIPAGVEEREAALTDALLRWKKKFGISGVVVALDMSYFSQQIVDVPVTSRTDIYNALAYELEKYLPLEPEQYSYDFLTVEHLRNGTKNLVLAVRKEKFRWIYDCVKDAGLTLLGFRCKAIEAFNGLVGSISVGDATLLFGDDGGYQVMGIRGSAPRVMNSASSSAEAEKFVAEIYEAHGKVLYTAGKVEQSAFDSFNPRDLSLDVSKLVASSLFRKQPLELDFLPEEYGEPKTDFYPATLGVLSAAAVLLFILTSVLSYYKDYSAVSEVRENIQSIKSSTKELVAQRRQIEETEERAQFLGEFKSEKNRKTEVLLRLSLLLTDDAWLTSFSADDKGAVQIDGFAKRAADIVAPLERSGLFKDVEFTSPVTVREGIERFSLTMQVAE